MRRGTLCLWVFLTRGRWVFFEPKKIAYNRRKLKLRRRKFRDKNPFFSRERSRLQKLGPQSYSHRMQMPDQQLFAFVVLGGMKVNFYDICFPFHKNIFFKIAQAALSCRKSPRTAADFDVSGPRQPMGFRPPTARPSLMHTKKFSELYRTRKASGRLARWIVPYANGAISVRR